MKTLLALSMIMISAAAAGQTPAPEAPRGQRSAQTVTNDTQLFQIVLLRASRKGADDIDGLPKSAEKALADVRDFLPFKHYALLDSAIVRMAYGTAGEVTMTPYQVKFSYDRKNDTISIWQFTVMPPRKVEQPSPPSGAAGPRAPVAPEAIKPLISTSFQMDRGETVVVGSSKLAGDEALLVLLTALPTR